MTSTHPIAFALCLGIISAQVVPFEPSLIGSPNFDVDLLLVIEKGKSLGRPAVDKALQKLGAGKAGLERQRELQVSLCRDCDSLDKLMAKHHLGEQDVPMVILFPMKSEDTRAGLFRLSLKGVAEPLGAMKKFLTSYDNGDLQAYVKSAPEPTAKEQQGPVRIVVGTSFEKEMSDADKHTVLLIYDENDGASKELKSIFQRMGQRVVENRVEQHTSPLTVSQFNRVANDFPVTVGFLNQRIPAIALFREGDTGDPDYCPEESMHALPDVLNWLDEMLPERNYPGMHAFLEKLAEPSASAIVGSKSGGDLQRFGSPMAAPSASAIVSSKSGADLQRFGSQVHRHDSEV